MEKTKIKFDRPDNKDTKNGISLFGGKIVLPSRPILLGEEWKVELTDKGRFYSARLVEWVSTTRIKETDEIGFLEVEESCGDVVLSRKTVKATFVEIIDGRRACHYYEYDGRRYAWFVDNPHFVSEGELLLQKFINQCGSVENAISQFDIIESVYSKLIADKKAIRLFDFDDVQSKWLDDGDEPYLRHTSVKYDAAIEAADNKLREYEQLHADFFRLQNLYCGEAKQIVEGML